ncbi:TonB-dependent receptor [Mucilaginibacter sp. L3T2-6]|uniref:TonB-dependent receptor domain-containing protein n=1 Tax=Mucilaginibacter sp. L3T2-6 TaxID=3062491 RepID=UPI0026767B3E|nr:TonB-dependent receptor [Mucilaginibacter sp. L3T2-6]MDO3641606.1 TonB-dependent receptor [Mucilaginibacter sp. L3T2-6]MDV6214100.1 TonB-dependent receptor [Mucilaginibacter sp. L3T2-6]
MSPKLIRTLLFVFIISSFSLVKAQQTTAGGTISGRLVDAANNQPLELATVSVVRKSDNHTVKAMQTDLQGNFSLSGIEDGVYQFRATYVSYLSFLRDTLRIAPGRRTVNLGEIKMSQAKGVLKEVTVTAQKSQIQLGIDKKSFNVEQSLVSQGGSATDLLSNVPSVQVDVDGNLSLRGSTSVKVLINGKASALTGGNIADILQSIPASSIETIEVITNPSSKYDAEGQSGIINIILKKNAQKGFTGSASASVGTQNTYNGNFNIAYQNKAVNVYANYSYRKGTRIGNGFSNKTTIADSINQFQNQINDQQFTFRGQNIRSGIDINLDPKTTLGFSNNINIRNRDRVSSGLTTITQNGNLLQRITQANNSTGSGTNLDLNLDFNHKYKKKGEELSANINYSKDKNDGFDDLISQYDVFNPASSLYTRQNNTSIGREHDWNFQADFTDPLKNGKFEAGIRSQINQSDDNYIADTLNNTTGYFDYNSFLSNHFIYKENINAAYTSFQHQFGNFGVQAGLRLEDSHIRTTLMDAAVQNHKQDYLRLYPSIFLSDKLSENQTLQLSYTRRVQRPRDRQLSPFLDQSDKLNYQQGNPDLRPEDTHSFELSYINYWKSLTLTSSLYYRRTNGVIQRITTPLTPTNLDTTLTTFENIKSASNAGYELIAKLSPSPTLDLTGNLNIYYRHLDGDAALNLATTSGYAWNGNLTANIRPFKKLGIQLRGDYQAPQVIPQGKMRAMYAMDGGLKYDITKTVSLSGNVRDIFNTRRFRSDINYNTPYLASNQVSERRWATRTAIFTLSWRFGNNLPQKRKEKRDNNQQQDQDNSIPDDGGGLQGGGGNPGGGGAQGGPQAVKPKGGAR